MNAKLFTLIFLTLSSTFFAKTNSSETVVEDFGMIIGTPALFNNYSNENYQKFLENACQYPYAANIRCDGKTLLLTITFEKKWNFENLEITDFGQDVFSVSSTYDGSSVLIESTHFENENALYFEIGYLKTPEDTKAQQEEHSFAFVCPLDKIHFQEIIEVSTFYDTETNSLRIYLQ